MFVPEILAEDLLIVPDNSVDIKIWINENIEMIRDTQPLFYKYLDQLYKVKGEATACAALITFLSIEHALKREAGCA